jgi:hypothetical protein
MDRVHYTSYIDVLNSVGQATPDMANTVSFNCEAGLNCNTYLPVCRGRSVVFSACFQVQALLIIEALNLRGIGTNQHALVLVLVSGCREPTSFPRCLFWYWYQGAGNRLPSQGACSGTGIRVQGTDFLPKVPVLGHTASSFT